MKNIKFKHMAMWASLLACSSVASCQEVAEEKYVIKGKAAHEDGTPVEAARMFSLYLKRAAPGSFIGNPTRTEIVETNAAGEVELEFNSLPTPDGAVAMGKKGYYGSTARAMWKPNGQKSWAAEVSIVLKPVKNPIPMHATFFGNSRVMIPRLNTDYGYDLEACSLVTPDGNGKHADLLMRVEGTNDGQGKGQIKLSIRANGDKAGFVSFSSPDREHGSKLISDYQAPEDGYSNAVSFDFNSDNMVAAMNQPKDGNFYFRARTVLNPDGTIQSCHYGKIYGPFTLWGIPTDRGAVASFGMDACYFNPGPNDRNVEFDPKRNLNPDAKVRQP